MTSLIGAGRAGLVAALGHPLCAARGVRQGTQTCRTGSMRQSGLVRHGIVFGEGRTGSMRHATALLSKEGGAEGGDWVDPWVEGEIDGVEESGAFGIVWRVTFVSLAVAATVFLLSLATPVIQVMSSTFPMK